MPSEEKVGLKGEPFVLDEDLPDALIVRNADGDPLFEQCDCAETACTERAQFLRESVSALNALHAAGIRNPAALPRAMEVVAARAISSPEIDAALAALRREP